MLHHALRCLGKQRFFLDTPGFGNHVTPEAELGSCFRNRPIRTFQMSCSVHEEAIAYLNHDLLMINERAGC